MTSTRQIAILLPNYRTPDLTKLCLRLLRRHSDMDRVRVIVIDNGSDDASLAYLRSLSWIELIEREPVAGESPSQSHVGALNLGLERVVEPAFLSIHTDTLIRRPGWHDYLLEHLRSRDDVAGVGSWKLELKPWHKLLAKRVERTWQDFSAKLGRPVRRLHADRFLRSHCALYDTKAVRSLDLRFGYEGGTVGEDLHRSLTAGGYRMEFLPTKELRTYMIHLNHATMVLNPECGARASTIKKGRAQIKRCFEKLEFRSVLADDRLDR